MKRTRKKTCKQAKDGNGDAENAIETSMDSVEQVHVDIAQLESNNPGEDRFAVYEAPYTRSPHPTITRGFGVFDGHGGSLAVDMTGSKLLKSIVDEINELPYPRSCEVVTAAIQVAFDQVDQDILREVKRSVDAVESSESKGGSFLDKLPTLHCRAGCCAVIALIVDDNLFVANVGDCRAIMLQTPTSNTSSDNGVISVVNAPAVGVGSALSGAVHQALCESAGNALFSLDSSLHAKASTVETPTIVDPSETSTEIINEESSDSKTPSAFPDSANQALQPIVLSVDHTLQSFVEMEVVRNLTTDPNPFRQSRNDKSNMRVAGTLAVTRALGDAYLKVREFSASPFAEYCPYISCSPTISHRKLLPADQFLVLGSDGLWNFMSPTHCALVLEHFQKSKPQSTPLCPPPCTEDSDAMDGHSRKRKLHDVEQVNGESTKTEGVDDSLHCIQVISHDPVPSRESESALGPSAEGSMWSKSFVPREQFRKGPFVCFSSCDRFENSPTTENGKQSGNKQVRGPATELLNSCVETAASENNLKVAELLGSCDKSTSNPTIKATRRFIDDVTVMVVELRTKS